MTSLEVDYDGVNMAKGQNGSLTRERYIFLLSVWGMTFRVDGTSMC